MNQNKKPNWGKRYQHEDDPANNYRNLKHESDRCSGKQLMPIGMDANCIMASATIRGKRGGEYRFPGHRQIINGSDR